jgi:hypothetical protein
LWFKSNLFKDLARELNSAAGVFITFQVMAVARQSTGDEDAVSPVFK